MSEQFAHGPGLSDPQRLLACKIAWETANAYSADIWGSIMWTEAAQMLLDMDFSEAEVVWILRSKNTRWARDAWGERSTWLGQLAVLAEGDREGIKAKARGTP